MGVKPPKPIKPPKPELTSKFNPFAGLIAALIYVGDSIIFLGDTIMTTTQEVLDAATTVASKVADLANAVAPLPGAVNTLEDAIKNASMSPADRANIDAAFQALSGSIDTLTSTTTTVQDAVADAMDGVQE